VTAQEITALRLQKKNRRRVNVYLDGDYAFALQAVLAASLKVGRTLSPDEVAELRQRDAAEIAYDKVLGYLSYRPRSSTEIETYLQKQQVEPEVGQIVVERLAQARLLNDEEFARYWVENRERFRPRGRYALRFELRRKGIPSAAIEKALQTVDEADSAYRAAHNKAHRLGQLDHQAFKQRLGGFLRRRGFAYDVAKETVERLWREMQQADEGQLP
jgi:regulatory protein